MFNKLIIGILIVLLVSIGILGAYTFNLVGEIDALSQQLIVSQEQQAAQISALSDELATFRGETLTRIDALDDELGGVTTELEQSVINAGKIYEEVSKGMVRISDGEKIVGSGFVFDPDGHIVTPQHVVEGQAQIDIILLDGSISAATIIGKCKHSDIAVLTLEYELAVEAVTLADSATVRVGEPVVVIGNPLDLPGTITSGIVSQTHRFVEVEYDSKTRWVANLIQFDAAVNFGNSGSPLLNSNGEAIGMVIARVDPVLGDGVYYAVSSNKVRRVALSLIDRGFFDYPWLGVEIANLTPEMVRTSNLETANGVLVKQITADSPAEAAGIKVNDIMVAIDGRTVRQAADLTWYLGEYKNPDEIVTLALIRDGAKLELSLKLGKW